jgi:hypothetical protein
VNLHSTWRILCVTEPSRSSNIKLHTLWKIPRGHSACLALRVFISFSPLCKATGGSHDQASAFNSLYSKLPFKALPLRLNSTSDRGSHADTLALNFPCLNVDNERGAMPKCKHKSTGAVTLICATFNLTISSTSEPLEADMLSQRTPNLFVWWCRSESTQWKGATPQCSYIYKCIKLNLKCKLQWISQLQSCKFSEWWIHVINTMQQHSSAHVLCSGLCQVCVLRLHTQ